MANDSKGQGITPNVARTLIRTFEEEDPDFLEKLEACTGTNLYLIAGLARPGKQQNEPTYAIPPFVTHSGSSALDHSGGASWSLLNRIYKMLRGGRHTRIQ